MLKFFRLPFATTGDKTAVPDAVDTNGNVSYSQGYGFDYQRQKTDPAAKNIERDKMNQIFFDVTTAIAELQANGIPDFITAALNGGTAYSYAQYAVVKYSGDLYISLVGTNTALPSDATKWALLPTPARIQAAFNTAVVAGGTADAITGAFAPAIAALPVAPGTLSVLVRAGSANTTTTPTFKADGTAAKIIVKGNNLPLVAGDIAGAGHWLDLQYDATLDKWVLQNPASGILTGIPAGSIIYTAQSTAPTGYLKANGAAVSRTTYAALFGSIGTVFGAGDGSTTFNLPDLRGEFPRGWDDGRGVDSGRAFGSAQAGQNASHSHGVNDPGHSHSQSGESGFTVAAGAGDVRGVFDYNKQTGSSGTGISIQSSGGTEARPRNVALLACIKY